MSRSLLTENIVTLALLCYQVDLYSLLSLSLQNCVVNQRKIKISLIWYFFKKKKEQNNLYNLHIYPSVWRHTLNHSPMLEMSLSCSLSESMFEHRESTIVSTWCSLTLLTRGPRLEESKALGHEYMYMYIYYYNNFNGCFVHLQDAGRMREGGRDGRLVWRDRGSGRRFMRHG